MNDDIRMQEDDNQADRNRNNNHNNRRGGMELPDDEPALDGYAR
jgi:hypothetical protein